MRSSSAQLAQTQTRNDELSTDMASVSVNSPKTPVTKGSTGIAAATVPNVCKMPGPPAPFVPAPLPNIGKSGDSPKNYSKKVKVEGNPVAIRGATFKSTGDVASKGTGGGLVSANTHGITKFVGPGSFDTKIEGKNVQLLSDPMLNNCGPSGNPPNAATLGGLLQAIAIAEQLAMEVENCGAGKHNEKVYFPDPPPDETSVRGRLAKMQQMAGDDRQDNYEIAAAQFNHQAGHLDHGKQISRKLTPEERAAGHHARSQEVTAICRVCGNMREIEHASKDGKDVYEAKYHQRAIQGGDQRRNNAAFAAKPGRSSTYKAPRAGEATRLALKAVGCDFTPTG